MPSEMEFVNYKEFVKNLTETESPTSADKVVVSNPTNGPRSMPGSANALTETATEADLVVGNNIEIIVGGKKKKLSAEFVAKRSIQNKVRYEVSKELGVDIADYTLTLHYFIPSYAASPQANNAWCYSSNIDLKAGETIYVRGSGTGTNVAMISSVSGTTYTNLVRSDGNSIKWYKYTNNSASDMTVALSGRTADGLYAYISSDEKTTAEKIEEIHSSVVAIETNLKSANDDITLFKHELGVDVKIPVINTGSFINNAGAVVTQNGWFTTDAFQLQHKETLNVYVRGYEKYVSVIAQDNGDDTYTSLIRSNDASGQSTLQWYSYTNNGDTAISVVCCGAVSSGIIAYVTKNNDSGIEGVVNNLNFLSSAVRKELDLSFVDAVMNAGAFINNVGAVVVQNNWYITSAFVLHSGETLKVNCAGYEKFVSVIAQDNGDDTYTSLIRSNDASGQSTLQWYEYKNETNSDINVVCSGSIAKGFFAYTVYEAEDEEKIDTFVDTSISLFSSVAVIGDSYASGVVVYPDGPEYGVSHYAGSWPQILGRMNGLNVTNYTKSGAWTTSFIQDATERGYAQMLADDAKELYIVALEINDVYLHNDNLGTEADCTDDPENNPTTFYGNYAKIVWSIQNKSPKSRILCSLTERASQDRPDKQNYVNHNNAIRYVANKYGVPVIDCAEAPFATDSVYMNKVGGHPTAIGYAAMAQGYRYLVEKAIRENVNYFRFYVGLDL